MNARRQALAAAVEEPSLDALRANVGVLRDALYDAYHTCLNGVRRDDPHWDEIGQLHHAGHRLADFHERRAARAEKIAQAALATDAISDELRAEILKGLHGSTRRDAKLLSERDAELLESYRLLGTEDRAVVRRYIGWAAGTIERTNAGE